MAEFNASTQNRDGLEVVETGSVDRTVMEFPTQDSSRSNHGDEDGGTRSNKIDLATAPPVSQTTSPVSGGIVPVSIHDGDHVEQVEAKSDNDKSNGKPKANVEHEDKEKQQRIDPQLMDDYQGFSDMRAGKVFLILLSLGLASFLYALEQTIVSTSIATIGTALGAQGSLTWISTSYLLTSTVFQPITGRLADAFGARPLLIVVLWIFILGNLVAGLAKTLVQLVIGRLISGIGAAGMLSLCIIIISQLTSEKQRGPYLNLVNFVFMIADTLGPVIGGALAQTGNWRWIFLINVPFGPFITFILLRVLRVPHSHSPRSLPLKSTLTQLDLLGMFTIIASLSFLIVGLNSGGQVAAWNSPLVIAMFVGFGVMAALFVLAERYAKMPVAPGRLFVKWRWRNVPIMMVARCFLFFHLFATTFYLPLFLQVLGLSEINSGALVIPFLSTAAISSTLAGFFTSKYGRVVPVWLTGLVILPIGLGLMSTLNEISSIGKIIGFSIISGFGFGVGTLISAVIPQVGIPEEELSTVTAIISTSASLGGVLGVAIVGTIINNTFRSTLLTALPNFQHENLNDIGKLIHDIAVQPGNEQVRMEIRKAFVYAWRTGYRVLVGVAVAQLLMSLVLRNVELDERFRPERGVEDGEEGGGGEDIVEIEGGEMKGKQV